MDYNLFVRHSGGFERTDEGAAFENRSFEAFKAAFEEQYAGKRIPLQIGFHFTLMNGGAYWRALERFARDVCLKPDVDCISYADYVARLKPARRHEGQRRRGVTSEAEGLSDVILGLVPRIYRISGFGLTGLARLPP